MTISVHSTQLLLLIDLVKFQNIHYKWAPTHKTHTLGHLMNALVISVPVCNSCKTIIWGAWDAWLNALQIKVLQLFCWPMWPPFVIGLPAYPMITHTSLVAGNLPLETLVARTNICTHDTVVCPVYVVLSYIYAMLHFVPTSVCFLN